MGLPMASNLARAGFDVVGYTRTAATRDRFASAGGVICASVAEATRGADVVITMLPDGPDVVEVVLGEDGVFANAKRGLIYDMSTISPDSAKDLADEGNRRQIRV